MSDAVSPQGEESPVGDASAVGDVATPGDGLHDNALRAELARVERKPPLYRAFRVALYSLYGLVAAWLIGAITLAIWQSVFGPPGDALRAREAQRLGAVLHASDVPEAPTARGAGPLRDTASEPRQGE
jgi:nitrate reductase NapE component